MFRSSPFHKSLTHKDQSSGIRILLVEDSPDDARFLRETLAEAPEFNFELREVKSLSAAISYLAVESYDVILYDCSLPDSHREDGPERIKPFAGTTPVIVLTGNDDRDGPAVSAHHVLDKNRANPASMVRSILAATGTRKALEPVAPSK